MHLKDTVDTIRLIALAAATGQKLTSGIHTRRPSQPGIVPLSVGLRALEDDLGALAATSADVSTTGQPTPGRGPIALALNQARTALAGAAALAEMAETACPDLAVAALRAVGPQITLAAAFATRSLAAGSAVGSG